MRHTEISQRNVRKQIADLKRHFLNLTLDPAIELVYLFGSHAANTAGPLSDFDIAIYFSAMPDHHVKYALAHQLAMVLDTDRIDIVILNRSPIELKYAVIATGTVIYEISKAARVDFESLTLGLYGDFLPVLRTQREELLRGSNHEAGIQRYRKAFGKTRRMLEEVRTFQEEGKG
ncbi:MAG: nucleotidyltransferase domain-containing protein [Desulfobacterales bacterium]